MRVGAPALLAVCLAVAPARAEPVAVEVAGTWSGNTTEPADGWRAAILIPLAPTTPTTLQLAAIARFDDHGAPAEHGDAATRATSLGAGLRAGSTWSAPASAFRLGAFLEGTLGRTRAHHADAMSAQRDAHWMISAGLVGGTRMFQVVADFGWLVTDAGDGRIGPIASLGVQLALD